MTNVNCNIDLKRTVPLMRVVSAAILDSKEDIGKTQELYLHWASRGLKKLNREVLKMGKQKVTLVVNRSTNTATLPPDFHEESFIGVMVNDKKIPLKLRPDLVDTKNIQDIPCEDSCPRCKQDKAICEDLTVTEDIVLVTVNGIVAQQTVIKKLYPNGNYYLETKIPVWDIDSAGIIYTTTKEFITAFDMKPCGCIDTTPANIEKIKCCCPDVYCSHFAPCDNSCVVDYGGYRIFEETGLIQFDAVGKFTQVYMEYWGFMPKKNGQYQVPEVAFETLVEWTKFKDIDGKRNIPNNDKQWRWNRYRMERSNMEKILGRISLGQIIQSIGLIPKFDLEAPITECFISQATTPTVAVATTSCDPAPCPPQVIVSPPLPGEKKLTPFQLAVIAGIGSGPTAGLTTYQSGALIGATNVDYIIVNNTIETIKGGQFTFDSVTGIIDRAPNVWFAGDVLIVPYTKLV